MFQSHRFPSFLIEDIECNLIFIIITLGYYYKHYYYTMLCDEIHSEVGEVCGWFKILFMHM